MYASTAAFEHVPQRLWKRGLAWLALLGPLFFASYGLANWLASLRPQVNAVVFDWEQSIPFLAWTIVPYWSIDLLYAMSLFFFATRRELDTHAWRLLAAQLIAVGCFIAVPLQFSFSRPPVDGVAAWLFTALESFDRPYNQAPSLHLALLVILWSAYAKWVRGLVWRAALHALFLVIGVSALTTWQHHFIDIPAGIWLGCLCVWLFPDAMRAPLSHVTHDAVRWRLAMRYGAAAILLAAPAIALGGLWLWLLWICAALGIVAAIYAFGNECAFQKRAEGSMTLAARWLLWPYLLGAQLNAWWWTRKSALVDAVMPGLFVGRTLTAAERARCGITAVVDVCAELPCRSLASTYASVPMLDLVTPKSEQIERACREIEKARAAGPLLVCCALGFSRSALVMAAWLLRVRTANTIDAAVAQVKSARPRAVLNAGHMVVLREWQAQYGRAESKRGRA